MFIIGGNQDVCPRGFICINNYNIVLILVIIAIGVYFFNKQIYLSIYNKMLEQDRHNQFKNGNIEVLQAQAVQQAQAGAVQQAQAVQQVQAGAVQQPFNNPTRDTAIRNQYLQQGEMPPDMINIDRAVIDDRLYPPLMRNYHTNMDGRRQMAVPINVETRGSGGDFQQVGILSKTNINSDDSTPGNNTDSNVLPLYGKPLYRGASKWLYYTETDKYNPIKIPITVNNKDCTDDQGCEELSDGGQVTIPSYNGVFSVKIYKFNKPRYIPLGL